MEQRVVGQKGPPKQRGSCMDSQRIRVRVRMRRRSSKREKKGSSSRLIVFFKSGSFDQPKPKKFLKKQTNVTCCIHHGHHESPQRYGHGKRHIPNGERHYFGWNSIKRMAKATIILLYNRYDATITAIWQHYSPPTPTWYSESQKCHPSLPPSI